MKFFILSLSCWMIIFQQQVIAQTARDMEAQFRKEIEQRGISEEEFQSKLDERGIDLEQLKELSIQDAANMKGEIESIIKEIETEKSKLPKNKKAMPTAIDSKAIHNAKISVSKSAVKDSLNIERKISNPQTSFNRDSNNLPESKSLVEIWGQEIFRNKSLVVYHQGNDVKPPDSYILGVGDQVTVAIWGVSQLNEVYEINSEGYITPSRMPRIFLKGVALSRAKSLISNYFKRFYRFNSNQIEVALNYSRTININIVGEVVQYGAYTLPAINTAFNALIAAGGPTNIGSVRKIKLIRRGVETTMDVYKFINNPAIDKNFYLENNDYIQVPVAGKVVSITGAIKRPYKYELIEGEDLNQLIKYAGGLNDDAIRKIIQVERIENDRKIALDVPYEQLISKGGDFALKKGDKVVVFSIKTEVEDQIFVKGEVRAPSAYKYFEGMKVSDLISKIEFTAQSNLQNVFIHRRNPDQTINVIRLNIVNVRKGIGSDNIVLQAHDELTVYKLSNYVDRSYVNATGSVRSPGKFTVDPKGTMNVKDLVMLAGGLRADTWSNAFLFRKNSHNPNDLEIIRINILKAINEDASDQNISIMPYDSLVLLSEMNFRDFAFIEVSGAVKEPGRFQFGKGMKINDVISLAQGFAFSAATNRIDIFRIEIKDNTPTKTIVKTIQVGRDLKEFQGNSDFEIEPFDLIVVRNQPEFELQQVINIEGEVQYPGPYALINPNEKVVDVIKRAGGLSMEAFPEGATLYREQDGIGFVVLNLTNAMKKTWSNDNLILKDKDAIYIPKKKDLVRISGATNAVDLYPDKLLSSNNAINVAFYEGKNARFYIDHYAAGISKNGDPNKITVEHANGRIEKTKDHFFFKTYPKVYKGSIVNVGYKDVKTEKEKKTRKEIDWGKVMADSVGQATAILSLILLLERLN